MKEQREEFTKTLSPRGPSKKPEPEPDKDISELCVALKELLQQKLLCGMATHETQDLMVEAVRRIDEIDAAAIKFRPKESSE